MDKLRAAQGLANLAAARQSGALTAVGAWLMVVGEEVRARAKVDSSAASLFPKRH
jgi:hypothetical protein